jgi:fructoselysine-6-P-deglycase FrlB-like protein
MQLRLSDPSYTDRLATFLKSLGQTVLAAGPDELQVDLPTRGSSAAELTIYLRVWKVLYPDADVHVASTDDGETPAA